MGALAAGLDRLESKMDAGLAMAAALTVVTPSGEGKTTVRVGYGGYAGQGAVGVAMAHRFRGPTPVIADVGIAASSGDNLVRAGLAVEF